MQRPNETSFRSNDNIICTIGTNVRRARRQQGLSAQELGIASGVPFSLICDLEMHICVDVDVLTVAYLTQVLMTDLLKRRTHLRCLCIPN